MSRENVEALSRFVDAYNSRDVEAVLAELDPEIEWRPVFPLLLGEAKVFRGYDGAREWLRSLYEVLDEAWVDYTEIRDLGDRVLAIGTIGTRGKGSGAETESPFAHLTDFRDGKALRIWTYLDPKEALEAAGLKT